MSEILSNEDIESIISYNKSTVEKRGEKFEVDKDCLYIILNRMNFYNYIRDRRQRIIKKATRILAGIKEIPTRFAKRSYIGVEGETYVEDSCV
jgi:hypothetical protein